MERLIVLVIIIGIVILFLKAKTKAKKGIELPANVETSAEVEQKAAYAYEIQGVLFTPVERSFYGVLCQACADNAVVFGKVRIADILKPAKGFDRSTWQKAFNQIAGKHFDYVLCRPDDLSIMSVVELDDNSHSQKPRIARDEFIESACNTASLKLYRFKASHGYNVAEVREVLFPAPIPESTSDEVKVKSPAVSSEDIDSPSTTTCPKCSSELVSRRAKRGANKGGEFLACSAFPKCRYTKELEG